MNSPTAIKTFTGLFFDPINPYPSLIRIEDIAHALARQTRFSGHVRGSWSVANHSLLVSHMAALDADPASDETLWSLLHDAAEAYMADLPKPVKTDPSMAVYRDIEDRLHEAIAYRFGLQFPMPEVVHRWDQAVLWAEADMFMHGFLDWNYQPCMGHQKIRIEWSKDAMREGVGQSLINRVSGRFGLYSPGSVEKMFLREFHRLTNGHIKRVA